MFVEYTRQCKQWEIRDQMSDIFYEFLGFIGEYAHNPAWLLKDRLWAAIKTYNQTLKTFYEVFKSHLTFQTSKHNDLDINLHILKNTDFMFLSAATVPPTLAPGGPAAPEFPGRPRGPLSPRSPCGEIHK